MQEKSRIFPELFAPLGGNELPPGDECGVLFTKNVVFRVFVEQVSSGASFMLPGTTDFSGLRNFRKLHFPVR